MTKQNEEQNIKITKLEVIMEQFNKGFDEIKTEFKGFEEKNDRSHKEITEKIDKFILAADEKYAPKALVWWLFVTIGGLALTELFRYVVR